jgi:hypothetical protein
MDSCGYFFNFMPYLTPELKNLLRGRSLTESNRQDFPWEVDSQFIQSIEDDFSFGEV